MLDPLQYYFWVLCNEMKTRFRMVMIAHPGPGIGFHKRFMWQIIILPTPGHIAKVCRGPHAQNVQNVDAVMTPRLTPEDLQLLIESVRAAMVSSAPMTPPHESEGEKTPGEEGF